MKTMNWTSLFRQRTISKNHTKFISEDNCLFDPDYNIVVNKHKIDSELFEETPTWWCTIKFESKDGVPQKSVPCINVIKGFSKEQEMEAFIQEQVLSNIYYWLRGYIKVNIPKK